MNVICTELRGTTIDMSRIRSILKGDAIDKNSQRKITSPYPDDDEFEMKFKLYDTQSAGRARYILTELEYNLQGGRNRASAIPNPKAEVEHIMPKKIEKTKWDSDLRDKLGLVKKVERNNYHLLWRDRLGNKTLLSSGKNASIQNLPFKDKMQKAYATDPLKITSGLSDYTKWDGKEIDRRQEKFASDALNIWHL